MSDNLTQNILDKKNELDNFLGEFTTKYLSVKDDNQELQVLLNDLIGVHSDMLNTVSISIGQSHQQKDFFYNKDLQKDYVITTRNFISTSFKVIDLINTLIKKHSLAPYSIGESAYYTLQKLINTFSDCNTKNTLKSEFVKRNISIDGFRDKFKKMKHKYLRLQLYVGIPFLLLTLLIMFLGEHFLGKDFNGIQLIGIKAILALSISIVGSSLIEGNVETDWTLMKGLSIRAVGWAAVFLLLYFLNPANPGDVY